MIKIIPAIYEKGIVRPLKKLPLKNHQKIELRVETSPHAAQATKAIIHVRNQIGKLIAESPSLSPLGG